MEPIQKLKTSAKDFFLNLGAIVALYTVVISFLNLLFTVINNAYPQITDGYNYYGSSTISFPTATLIIVFPIFVILMWLLRKNLIAEPDKKNLGVRKWLTYITLFIAGCVLAGDLVSVLYYFLDGQELTVGFLLKVLSVFVVTAGVFLYYISDIKNKLTLQSQKIWFLVSVLFILVSIFWGFSVLGSPRTQRLLKYDEQKVMDLQNIQGNIVSYFQMTGKLPETAEDLKYRGLSLTDSQTQKPYEYHKTGNTTFTLCAEFNEASQDNENILKGRPVSVPTGVLYDGTISWAHPVGNFCFSQVIQDWQYPKKLPM